MSSDEISTLLVDLRQMARSMLGRQITPVSLQPTELALSALRRAKGSGRDWSDLTWENREAFFALLHRAMRTALIDHARHRMALKRPRFVSQHSAPLDFTNLPAVAEERPERILALEEAMEWLEQHDAQLARIISHHYFTGLSVAETAVFSGTSDRTVKRRLAEGRILLHRKIMEVLSEWN